MIVEMLLDVIYYVLSALWVVEIPSFPNELIDYIEFGLQYITPGLGLIANYTPLDYLVAIFGLVITIDLSFFVLKFVLWLLKKIPLLGIE